MSSAPIGVFDSGLGGLTAAKELINLLPHEHIVYFGDTLRLPYGSRDADTIVKFAKQDINFLLSKGVKAIIAACGTVSSNLPKQVAQALPVPYFDVIEPSVQAALAATKNKKIGVIGTAATIKSGRYEQMLRERTADIEIFSAACPLFVPLVENGFIEQGDEITLLAAQRYLAPLKAAGVDTLIMGCTHYPIIAHAIGTVMGGGVTLINSGEQAAKCAIEALNAKGLLNAEGEGSRRFYVSDTAQSFEELSGIFLGSNTQGLVEIIDIEKY